MDTTLFTFAAAKDDTLNFANKRKTMTAQQSSPIFLAAFWIICSTIFLSPAPAQAATLYVAPSGSDTYPGTASRPFATLQKAADTVTPGDTVSVRDGNYRGFRLSTSGTPAQRIVFSAASTAAVIDSGNSDGYGILLSGVSYITIQGFTIKNVANMGIAHRNASPDNPVHGLVIRGNTIVRSQSVGMYFSEIMDSLIENNEVDHCGLEGTHCVYMANAGTGNTTIRGNSLHHCLKAGIHFNGDESVGGDGIISGLIVEQNTIYSNGLNALNMDGVQDSIVRNNLIYDNIGNGIRAFRIDASEGPKNLTIVNNTIIVPQNSGGWAVRITAEQGGNTVFNNILLSESDVWGGSIAIDDDSIGFSSSHNIVINRFTPDRDDTMLTLKQWQALGYDNGSFLAGINSLFIDPDAGDYRLIKSSPAIDAGIRSFAGRAAPDNDMLSGTRPQGANVDIGAYEFSATSPPPPSTPQTACLPFIPLLL